MPAEQTWPTIISSLLDGEDLSVSDAAWCMEQVMTGTVTQAQLAGFLIALRVKGETVDEIVGFRDAVLEHAVPLPVDPMALDIVGTGGDRFGTVNVSTMASVVAAASGVPVIKHGNRAASSSSGSSDVLAALGLDLSLPAERVAEVLGEVGHHLRVRRRLPPRLQARGSGARRARRADGLQLPRPALQPRPPRGIGGRRRASRPRPADRRRVPDPRRHRARVPRRRRARRAHHHRAQPHVGGLARAR